MIDIHNTKNPYLDGAEAFLLEFFQKNPTQEDIDAVLRTGAPWSIQYHLAEERQNLLSWYPWKQGTRILEIGAGCGAMTGVLLGEQNQVTAVEVSEDRAKVIETRHAQAGERLRVIRENFQNWNSGETYDYVTSIGVLEYAGTFFDDPNPGRAFVQKAYDLLEEGGVLVVAIENKFGIKYWAGAREDHTGNFFESIEGYPGQTGITTYSRKELEHILKESGFSTCDFYYPFPDYKLPKEIYSDAYLPNSNHQFHSGVFPTPEYAQEREYLFDERRVMHEVIGNDMVPFFANSFLVFAKK